MHVDTSQAQLQTIEQQILEEEEISTLLVIASADKPGINYSRIGRLNTRVNISCFECKSVFDFIRHACKIESHQRIHRVVFAHPIYKLTDTIPLPGRNMKLSSTMLIEEERPYSFSYGVDIKEAYASSYNAKSKRPLTTVYHNEEVSTSIGATDIANWAKCTS